MKINKLVILVLLLNAFTVKGQSVSLEKLRLNNKFFKNNLISILNLEEEHVKQERYLNLDYDFHYILVEKKKNKLYSITIARLSYSQVESELYIKDQLGYFYLKNNLFIVNGMSIDGFFDRLKHIKKFVFKSKDIDDDLLPLFDGGLPEWNFILSKGYLLLESGYIE